MPFFIRGKNSAAKAASNKKNSKSAKSRVRKFEKDLPQVSKRAKFEIEDEEITSEEDDEFLNKFKEQQRESSSLRVNGFSEETADEKKERLAKEYIEELKKQYEEKEDAEEIHKEISLRLKKDVLEAAGHLYNFYASRLEEVRNIEIFKSKHHKQPLTCLVVSFDEKYIFTASKDCAIVKWSISGEKKGFIRRLPKDTSTGQNGHSVRILSLAISSDDKFLASGDGNGVIHIWDAECLRHLKTFTKHHKAISGLVFRQGTHNLFSASHDRMVMSWNLDAMGYAESLGGHQDCITGIDALQRESCITSGGRDETVIVYAIIEDKQLRFSAEQTSIDGVKLLNEKTFVTFAQNGSLSLWTTSKKKPHCTIKAAHGKDSVSGEPNWIVSVAALANGDIVASGSNDGYVRLWKVLKGFQKLEPLQCVAVPGIVNHLEFTRSGSHLLAAVGKEHKLGRWYTDKAAPNALVVIPLNFSNND